MPCPASVEVGDDVDAGRIAAGVIIHTGCRLLGAKTSIGAGCELGAEAPATVDNCQLGHKVSLKGGYFSGATFLDGSNMGSAAHVRPGTLLEEEAGGAHAVGFKQTIFLPFVTAGSLINFCDGLMSGGTSRKDHSEIGSSYIHFNFTPHQDKATASLLGDVPRGVMLDRPAIFLGGQGGLVGPVRIGFGTVIPAGLVWRDDVLEDGLLVQPEVRAGRTKPYQAGAYREIGRVVRNNLVYLGNIRALQAWYAHVRKGFMSKDPFSQACWEGARCRLDDVVDERIKRLGELAGKMARSIELAKAGGGPAPAWLAGQERLAAQWPAMEEKLRKAPPDSLGARERDALLAGIRATAKAAYLDAVRALMPEARRAGVSWLSAIVESASAVWS